MRKVLQITVPVNHLMYGLFPNIPTGILRLPQSRSIAISDFQFIRSPAGAGRQNKHDKQI